MRALLRTSLNALPRNFVYEVFYQAARILDIEGYAVSGKAGVFVGALRDQSVIRPYLRNRSWSAHILGLLEKFFADLQQGTFLDIGANIGLLTVPISRLAGVSCIAFEPDPQNCSMLQANVAWNCGKDKVQVVRAALGNVAGKMRFSRSEYNSGDHRLDPDGPLTVSVIRLDDYPVPLGPLAVKIDAQGAEPLIFDGARNTLARADLIITEFWPWGMARMGTEPKAILDFARERFAFGQVLQHEQLPGRAEPIRAVLERLQEIIADGGEHAQADLILMK